MSKKAVASGSSALQTYDFFRAVPRFALSAPSSSAAGSLAYLTVTAVDASGNVLTDYAGTVSLASTDPLAGLPASYTFTTGDQGNHSFAVTLGTVGDQTVYATDGGGQIGGAATIHTVPGALSRLAIAAPVGAKAGTPISVTVTALDAYGNVITDYAGAISFGGTSTAGLPASYTFTASDLGRHTFAVTLLTPGDQTLSATDRTGAISGQAVIQVTPAFRPVFARVVHGTVRRRRRLLVAVYFADTMILKREFPSPFQAPGYQSIRATAVDSDGDGIPDQVVVTARRNRKTVTVKYPG